MDGIKHIYQPGEEVLIYPGNSISITPGIAHTFGPKPGMGDLICGEVSKLMMIILIIITLNSSRNSILK